MFLHRLVGSYPNADAIIFFGEKNGKTRREAFSSLFLAETTNGASCHAAMFRRPLRDQDWRVSALGQHDEELVSYPGGPLLSRSA
jgi:hypothetical protein